MHLSHPQFIIKDLGIVIEQKFENSRGSYSLLDLSANLKGSGSMNSQKESGNSSGFGLKLGQELRVLPEVQEEMKSREYRANSVGGE